MIIKKRSIFIVLVVVLILESLWAVSYIQSAKKTINIPLITDTLKNQLPKEKIASMSLEPSTIETKVNTEFSVKINIDTNKREVNGIDALISYDPAFLTVSDSNNQTAGVQAENGDLFSSLIINSVDPLKGKINLTASRLSKAVNPVSGTGTLAALTFIAKKTGSTLLTIVFDPEKTNTSNIVEANTSKNILTTVTNAKIEIK